MARSQLMEVLPRLQSAGVVLRRRAVIGGIFFVCVVAILLAPKTANAVVKSTISKGPFQSEVFAMSPPRYDFDKEKIQVQPGGTYQIPFSVQNRYNHPIDVDVYTSDIESSSNPVEVLRVVRRSQYGAGDWITLEKTHFHLVSGEKLSQVATVRVPTDIGGGSYYAAITARSLINNTSSGSAQVKAASVLNSSVYITLPGDANISGHIDSAEAPTFQFDGTGSTVPFYVVWKNTGNVTDAVGGRAYVKSIFGNTVYNASFIPATVLRGGKRQFQTTWRDTPWIGLFRPKVEFVGRNGVKESKTLSWVLVLPPWYYIVALFVALTVPMSLWLRNRRRWNALMLELYGDGGSSDWDEDQEEDGAY